MEKTFFEAEQEAFERYVKAIGGDLDPIGLEVPDGYPDGVEEHGGVIAVYEECIKKGVTWEELLNYKEPPEDVIL